MLCSYDSDWDDDRDDRDVNDDDEYDDNDEMKVNITSLLVIILKLIT